MGTGNRCGAQSNLRANGLMAEKYLELSDFEYVADLLRAIRTFAPEFENLSDAVKQDLFETLGASEAALRTAAAETAIQDASTP